MVAILSVARSCSIIGPYTGAFNNSGELNYLHDQYLITNDPDRGEGNYLVVSYGDPGGGWGSGYVKVSGTSVTVTLNDENAAILEGRIDPDCSLVFDSTNPPSVWIAQEQIKKVHVVSMNHLDVGYNGIYPTTGFIVNVLNRYFDVYFPRAMAMSAAMRASGTSDRFIYTTHPFLVSLYVDCPPNFVLNGMSLHCPTSTQVDAMEGALRRGDIVMHAGAFNVEIENVGDPGLWGDAVALSRDLAQRYGIAPPRTLSQRDVPGMTRSTIAPLLAQNVTAISIGCNQGSAPPGVPKNTVFMWKDPNTPPTPLSSSPLPPQSSSPQILATLHPGGYPGNHGPSMSDIGGLHRSDAVIVPNHDEALVFYFRTDNSGPPPNVAQIFLAFSQIRSQFPGAEVVASTFDAFFDPIRAKVANGSLSLPVVQQEQGDTWVVGVASDPRKMSAYRIAMRQRAACVAQGKCDPTTTAMKNATRFLIKPPEHTWGLPGVKDTANWTNAEFDKVRNSSPTFVNNTNAWLEQRVFTTWAVDALMKGNAVEQELGKEISEEIVDVTEDVKAPDPMAQGYTKLSNPSQMIVCRGGIEFAWNKDGGGLGTLRVGGVEFATSKAPFAQPTYSTFNETDFQALAAAYDYLGGSGFDKPNSTTAAHPAMATYLSNVTEAWSKVSGSSCSSVALVAFPPDTVSYYGATEYFYINFTVATSRPFGTLRSLAKPRASENATTFACDITLLNKTSTRLAEFMAIKFPAPPSLTSPRWVLDKLGSDVDPNDVMVNGTQWTHAVFTGFSVYNGTSSTSTIDVFPYDLPLAHPYTASRPVSPFMQPLSTIKNPIIGIASGITNNIWDTNYPLYALDSNYHFRFDIVLSP